jgi:transposase
MRKPRIKVINGKKYAYDMQSFWDKEQKKYRKKCVYLGRVIDEENGEYIKKQSDSDESPVILVYGDVYSINACMEHSIYSDVFKSVLPGQNHTLMSLICYKLLRSSAMQHVQTWSSGNYASVLYKNATLSSQQISVFLKKLGNERVWRKFFKSYIEKTVGEKTGVIVDSTGLPNEIDFPLSACGNHGGESESQTRLIMVVERNTGMPLYFRYMPGNIVDVSSLSNTIEELREMGINTSFALIDAGYYSEANITELFANNISFLTRLPANRTLYKNLVRDYSSDLEKGENLVAYGKRALYVKRVQIDLFSHIGYCYIICDIKRKADEITRFFIGAREDKLNAEQIDKAMQEKGKFILISSVEIPVNEVIPLYYTRQCAENLFGVSKSFLDILPIRTHSIATFRGYLMLTFLALIVYIEYKRMLRCEYTVEGALMEMSNLMCRIYDNNKLVVSEPTKKMKEICNLLGCMEVKFSGV